MSDVTYSVAVEYLQSGNLTMPAGLKTAADSIEKAQRGFAAVGQAAAGFNSMLDSIGGSLMSMASGAAMGIGTVLATGFAAAVKEAFHFNQEMEQAQVGMANIANASGLTANLSGAFRLSGDVIKQMRVDARELPGEFKDLQNIMSLIEPATANAGMGMFGTEKMASQTMVAAAMLNVPMAVAGREMGMMLAGNARHSMPMFTKLGFTDSKEFNKMSQHDRVAAIDEKLGKLNTPEALGMVKNTWEVIRSTAVDTFRQSIALVGGPLFEHTKDLVKHFNDLGNSNPKLKEHLVDMGVKLGDSLVHGLDYGIAAIQHWYGPVSTFIGTMERGFERIFGRMGPFLGQVMESLEGFMNNPAAFSKIEHILEMGVAMRVGGGALEAGASMAPGMLNGISTLAGGGAAGATAALEAIPPVAIALGLAALAAEGFTHALVDSTSVVHDQAVYAAKQGLTETGKLIKTFTALWNAVQPLVDIFGYLVVSAVTSMISVVNDAVDALNGLSGAFVAFGAWLAAKFHLEFGHTPPSDGEVEAATRQQADLIGFNQRFNAPAEREMEAKKPPPHVTNIHKVEIQVNGDADPSRVAKLTVEMLLDKARNPTQSRGGPRSFTNLGY